ncbi:MAG TPA: FtsQ-type POTRA domain-containing protein [Acidimicrobiales bacterium]|nr:FtsQ-type POTRA domain-containing protein [Acidimicrobiales bacterium]
MQQADDPLRARPIRTHPRIRERRAEVRRDAGRRRLRILLNLAVTAGLVAAGFGVTRSPLLDVDTVDIRGATHTPRVDVLDAAGLDERRAMLDLDVEAIERRVRSLPWVAEAHVRRDYPGTVAITLQERTPIAAVRGPGEGSWALVDLAGRVLAEVGAVPPDLPVVAGPAADAPGSTVPPATRGALAVLESLPEVLAGRIPQVDVADAGAVSLRLDGRIPVAFGPPVEAERKLVALATLVTRADLRRVSAIDVRVPAAPVLTRG